MTKEELYNRMDNPEMMDESTVGELKEVVRAYPYFHTARLLYTKNLEITNHKLFQEKLPVTAVLCSDRRQLLYLIRNKRYTRFLNHETDLNEEGVDRTEALLNSFLDSLPESEEIPDPLPDSPQQIAATDYFAYLESLGESDYQDEKAQPLQHQDIIDAFIAKAETDALFSPSTPSSNTPAVKPKEEEKQEIEGQFLTETLAYI